MFTPAEAIDELDASIAAVGQTVTFKRGATTGSMAAMVRGFKPAELVGLIKQGDRSIVLSPTSLGAFGIPQATDKVLLATRPATVQSVEPIYMADVLVRINLVARGD